MPRLALLSLLFCFAVSPLLAQTKKIDSLRTVLAKHPQPDTFRVNRLYDLSLAEGNLKWPPDKPAYLDSLATEVFKLASQLNYPLGQAKALNMRATLALAAGHLLTYKAFNKKALFFAQKTDDRNLSSQILMNLGMVEKPRTQEAYFRQALATAKTTHDPQAIYTIQMDIINLYGEKNYAAALQWAMPLLKQVEKDTNSAHQYLTLSKIGNIYASLHDQDQALHYLLKSQLVARKRRDKAQLVDSFIEIGNVYQRNNQFDRAIGAYKQALLHSKNFFNNWLSSIPLCLAECYQQKGDDEQALTYVRQALAKMNSHQDDQLSYYQALLVLGQVHLHRHQLDSALFYSKQCLPLMRYFVRAGFLQFPNDVTNVLARIYAQQGRMDKAFEYLSLSTVYKDSLTNEAITRKATAIQFNEQMDRQQDQIALLTKDKQLQTEEARRQRQLLYTTLAILLLIGSLLVLLFRNNRQKQRANALLQEQKMQIQHQRDQIHQALTDLKITQVQLVQKEKMASLGELTAGIAHEIQNPLNFVNNFSEVSTEMVDELAQEHQKPHRDGNLEIELLTDLRDNLQKITHHGQRASSIVRGMLQHSRTSTGERQPTDLNALADEFLRLAFQGQRAKAKDFRCELVTHFDPALGRVSVMPQEMGQVLLNLFNNAFYAVHKRSQQPHQGYKPQVKVTIQRTPESVQIQVADNGVGLSKMVESKIFQPFFTTKPPGEGTGLGLSLAYDIITKGHGGSLTVTGEEGQGAAFTLTLPA